MSNTVLWICIGAFAVGFGAVIYLLIRSGRDEYDFEIFPDTDKASRAAAPADHRFTRAK